MAKEQDPKLNRVTVYRTLKMLKAGGPGGRAGPDALRRATSTITRRA